MSIDEQVKIPVKKKLSDKVAVITGGSRGIGRAIALLFASEGAHVIINFHKNEKAALQVLEEIAVCGYTAYAKKASAGEDKAVKGMMDEVYGQFGKIDILVNNAGILKVGYFAGMTPDEWNEIININLNSSYYCSRAVLPYMIQEKKGIIINICSYAGISGLFNEGHAVYAASKAAGIGFTKALAKELKPMGISVSGIAPGLIDTDMLHILPQKLKDRFLDKIPLKRMGTPPEIADIALFLAADESASLSGRVIISDGGWLA